MRSSCNSPVLHTLTVSNDLASLGKAMAISSSPPLHPRSVMYRTPAPKLSIIRIFGNFDVSPASRPRRGRGHLVSGACRCPPTLVLPWVLSAGELLRRKLNAQSGLTIGQSYILPFLTKFVLYMLRCINTNTILIQTNNY